MFSRLFQKFQGTTFLLSDKTRRCLYILLDRCTSMGSRPFFLYLPAVCVSTFVILIIQYFHVVFGGCWARELFGIQPNKTQYKCTVLYRIRVIYGRQQCVSSHLIHTRQSDETYSPARTAFLFVVFAVAAVQAAGWWVGECTMQH